MEAISHIDRLVIVLRQRMMERSKSSVTGRKEKRSDSGTAGWVDNLHALAALERVDDHQLRRALVQNILADQFGSGFINDPKFQQVVERVTEALEADEAGSVLINRCVTELRLAAS
jgi:hypothetical protein